MSCDVARPWQSEATLLRAARTQDFQKHFLCPDTKFVSETNVARVAKRGNIWETWSRQQCCRHNVSSFCRGLRVWHPRKSAEWGIFMISGTRQDTRGSSVLAATQRTLGLVVWKSANLPWWNINFTDHPVHSFVAFSRPTGTYRDASGPENRRTNPFPAEKSFWLI